MRNSGPIPVAQLAQTLRLRPDAGPAYFGVANTLRSLILDGRLPVGSRIPSERALASELRVGRITVTAAYDVLRFEGYLVSSRGGGSRVSLPADAPVRPDHDLDDRLDRWDLTVAALPAPAALVDALTHATARIHPLLANHGLHPLGLPELREAVAAHLSRRGLATSSDQILITNGALHGWHLVLEVLTRPGDRVLVEQPTYPAVLDALSAHRRRPSILPVSASGWGRADRPTRLAHVTPDGQNPTGLVATDKQRRRLVDDLDSEVVACDETFADLILGGAAPPPLATLDPRVVTLGSMSKAFWAGLRIGWIRAERDVLTQLALARAYSDLASPVLEQLVAAWLLEHADGILEERRALLRRSRDALTGELARQLPDWRYHFPTAGMVLWVELPEPGATAVATRARNAGLRLTPGPRFSVDGTGDRWLRLPFTLPPDETAEMVGVLARAAEGAASGPSPSGADSRWTV